jgi:uncharacterized iron-regulated protein
MRRRRFIAALGLAAAALASRAAHPAQGRAKPLTDHPLNGRCWDANASAFVTMQALVESLKRAHFRLLGEVHDNADAHAVQSNLLDAIGAAGLTPLVAFEQFDLEHAPALREKLARADATAEQIAEAVRFDRKGWDWALYRPLVATALRYGMPLRAANLSRAAAAKIAKQGLPALEPSRLDALRLEAAWNAERERALEEIIAEGHCGALPASVVPRMAAAQRVRDATMAEALLEVNADGAVLIAGNGHVRRDLAVPLYLAAAQPGRGVCAVGILEVEPGADDPQAYLESAGQTPPYDYVRFVPRTEREDPCAGFRK